MRKGFFELSRQNRSSVTIEHVGHCANVLRQYVQCHAPSDPLYTWGNFTTGDGQNHMCRDWTQLRDWAYDHRTCDKQTGEQDPLLDLYGGCASHDGLLDLL